VIAARTGEDLDKVEADIKKTNPRTQVLKVITDVSSNDSVQNLFNETFNIFNEVDVSSFNRMRD
jgi:NADP-dependent 3-hydroxy acid dehydrogenase YdfG